MSVNKLYGHIQHINDLVTLMLAPHEGGELVLRLTKEDKLVIIQKSYPHVWSHKQVKANLQTLDLNEQVQYYEGLCHVEDDAPRTCNNNNNCQNNHQNNNQHDSNNNSSNNQQHGTICPIHSIVHHGKCKMMEQIIECEHNAYEQKQNK